MSRHKDIRLLSQALKCNARLLIVGRTPPWRLVEILSNVRGDYLTHPPKASSENDHSIDHAIGRLDALYRTDLMDSSPEERFDRLTRLVATTLSAPVALVSLVDSKRQFFKSTFGLPEPWKTERETPLTHSFCQHVVHRAAPLVIDDATLDPLVCDNLAVPELNVRAYLGVPLMAGMDMSSGPCARSILNPAGGQPASKPSLWTSASSSRNRLPCGSG